MTIGNILIIAVIVLSAFGIGFKVGCNLCKKREERIDTAYCDIKGIYEKGKTLGSSEIGIVKTGKKIIDIKCGYLTIPKTCSISKKKCKFK